jgi:hypothetical protein
MPAMISWHACPIRPDMYGEVKQHRGIGLDIERVLQ